MYNIDGIYVDRSRNIFQTNVRGLSCIKEDGGCESTSEQFYCAFEKLQPLWDEMEK